MDKSKHMLQCLCCKWRTRTPYCFCKHTNDMYIYSHTNIKDTPIHTRRKNKSNSYSQTRTSIHLNPKWKSNQTHIFHIHHEVLFLNVIHVKERKTLYVYLLQGAEAAEDWVRQWYQLIARKPQRPVGRREDRVRLKLVAIAAPSCVPQCVCACQCVCVLTSRNKHVNRAHTPQRS
jgi:hypothetical protein